MRRKFFILLALFLITAGFAFAAPLVDVGESPPVGVACTAVAEPADIVIMPALHDQAVINDDTNLNIAACAGSIALKKDSILYNLQRQVESETIFGYY